MVHEVDPFVESSKEDYNRMSSTELFSQVKEWVLKVVWNPKFWLEFEEKRKPRIFTNKKTS